MDDTNIVELYWARSDEAIYETHQKYGNYCFSIAHNILPSREDAEESVNDTYLAAWRSIPPHRPTALSTFLGKITRRISIDRWRRMSAEKRGGSTVSLALEELAECIPSSADPAAELEARELTEFIGSFLDTLPSLERTLFLKRYFNMEKLQDIARNSNISLSKAKSMLYRTRVKLRAYLEKEVLL